MTHEFRRLKAQADAAVAGLDDAAFFQRPGAAVNPVALVVKHLAGNLASRWADVKTTDGEKPNRDRDSEFVVAEGDSREHLLAAWERGWGVLFDTLDGLTDDDLSATVTIRGEAHTLQQALLRGLSHAAYHTGQVLYVARLLRPDLPWQTVPPGGSRAVAGGYRAEPGAPKA